MTGCGNGSSKAKIPAPQADRLIKAIKAADQYNADGRCKRAHTKVRDARFLLNQVPPKVDADVRQGIRDGLARLDGLISSECERATTTDTTTETTNTAATETVHTESTATETTPTQTTTTQTQTDTTPTTTQPTTTTPTTTTGTTTTGNGGTPPPSGVVDRGGGTG